jgi:exonuclease SbcD
LVHTSDWHVGRTLRGISRAAEHEEVLAEIAGIAAAERADVVLVAGDLFDTAAPSPEAERIVYQALLDLEATGATVVVLAGNHDNERRLQAVEPLLRRGRIITRARFAKPDEGGLLRLTTASGEPVVIAVLPFLSQRYVVRADELMSGGAPEHAVAYAERVRRLLVALCAGFGPGTVNLVAAHLFAFGARLGGGERAAHTILDYAVPATAFPSGAHYVALGHLHRAQQVPGPCPIHYCGSPLQLDFGETEDEKAVLVVDASVGRPAQVRTVALGSGRRLRTITGTLSELAGVQVGTELLRVVVREAARAGLADDVRDLFPDAVEVVQASPSPDRPGTADRPRRAGRTPHELFSDYLAERSVDDDRLPALFAELLEEVHAT